MIFSIHVCFFFFQAEDGIRDYKVTGVQTCALPISPDGTSPPQVALVSKDYFEGFSWRADGLIVGTLWGRHAVVSTTLDRKQPSFRSEERRVGKECRSRWSPYH